MQQSKLKDKLPDEKELKGTCICPNCPTYVDCDELAFCLESSSKSKCIRIEKGCLCPPCPVESLMGFRHGHYCTRGNEKTQLGKNGKVK
ncbi:MAG: DUF2769 domain-containing protein [Methanotrichaceae archaeon]|nr:DUF2769 domain-containing protein [Methanotrichaceae archaeon]